MSDDAIIDNFFTKKTTENNAPAADFFCGFVAIVGRPNVGKSTLMNHLLGQKLSITSRKPQTTRHKILGILSEDDMQAVFVDTPGMHKKEVKTINQLMNKAADSALVDVDVVLFVLDSDKWQENDTLVMEKLQNLSVPVVAVLNKADTMDNKNKLLPYIAILTEQYGFKDIVPISALKNQNLDTLKQVIKGFLPQQPAIYDTEQITDRSERFLASEVIREKIMRTCGDEIPYDLTVQIDSFKDEAAHTDPETGKKRKACTFIDATVFVERAGQKTIIIGNKGARIKQISTEARLDLEQLFDKKIMLTLWIKVKRGWSDDARVLASLGY